MPDSNCMVEKAGKEKSKHEATVIARVVSGAIGCAEPTNQ